MISLSDLVPAMRQTGIRRVLILSGDAPWRRGEARRLCAGLPALWIGEDAPQGMTCLSAAQARGMLGQETDHVVFDAGRGCHAEALAAAAGAMRAGSWLVLLVPPWEAWPSLPDDDSLRWNDAPQAIATPHFVAHFKQCCQTQPGIAVWRQGEAVALPSLPPLAPWMPPDGMPTAQQRQILHEILHQQEQVAVVTGARGRGKSTLAGMLAARMPGRCRVTGPNRLAAAVLCRTTGDDIPFSAPDALLAQCREQPPEDEWLLIDEAAAIPAPLLTALTAYFPRILMTTTVQGYEGTGRGFILKVCADLPSCRQYTLERPVRWGDADPLEAWLNALLLFEEPLLKARDETTACSLLSLTPAMWQTRPGIMQDFYTLLTSAHYRTTPLDLRRLMDAGGNTLHAALEQETLIGALWLVDEGGLPSSLAQAVWAGTRRPKGNLVAQSLAAHGGQSVAAQLRSRRVSRIAVFPDRRRRGIARRLLACALREAGAAGMDYVSVSFGYTPALWRFWHACGFRLVRFGTAREASSGCYTAMAMVPLSEAGQLLCERLTLRLRRDAGFIAAQTATALPVEGICDQTLNQDDRDELNGFAFATRPLESAQYALRRYLTVYPGAPRVLHDVAEQGLYASGLAARYGLPGRKALLAYCRQVLGGLLRTGGQPTKK